MFAIRNNKDNMARTEHYYTRFEEDKFYHVYNRSIDKKPMFCNVGNYEYFLKQYNKYLTPVVDTYAYCLLGNHFHLIVRIRPQEQMPAILTFGSKVDKLLPGERFDNFDISDAGKVVKSTQLQNETQIPGAKSTHDIVSHQFRKFFQSYAIAFNIQQNRIGTLFQTPFKRGLVDDDIYLTRLIYYIHSNPQSHGLINDFRKWNWSSYNIILNNEPSILKKQEILDWFGGKEKYEQYHIEKHEMIKNDRLFFEDDV